MRLEAIPIDQSPLGVVDASTTNMGEKLYAASGNHSNLSYLNGKNIIQKQIGWQKI